MNKKLVRCYRGEALGAQDRLEDVWFTMPDFGDCDRLFSCTSCGTLFVASPEAEHYSGVALQKRIEQFVCPECSAPLPATLQPYPQTFRMSDGSLSHFDAGRVYPPDSESVVKEVWDIYG